MERVREKEKARVHGYMCTFMSESNTSRFWHSSLLSTHVLNIVKNVNHKTFLNPPPSLPQELNSKAQKYLSSGLLTAQLVGWLLACLMSQQQASVSQGRICSDNFMCCHTETEVADPTFYLTQSQYTDNRPTSPNADPITPGAWQGSHWSANFEVTGMTRPRKNPGASGIRTRDLRLSRQTPYH